MKYLWTTVHVKNMDESILFYSDILGLKLMQRFPAGPGIEIAFLGNGTDDETLVELYHNGSDTVVNFGEFISLGFAVTSVDEILNTVKNKSIPLLNGPNETQKFKWFTVKDPNGLNIQFFQQKNS